MGEHDAASAAGQMAGLGNEGGGWTPEVLARRFGTATERRDEEIRATMSRGSCSYMGGRGPSFVVGFDDGYDFLGGMEEHGWRAIPEKGDWPYVVYCAWKGANEWAIAEYVEGDFTLWRYDDREAALAHCKTFRDCP